MSACAAVADAPANEAAATGGAAAAAGVARPAPDVQQLSTVEAAFPGSFCAELWHSVKDVYRCAGVRQQSARASQLQPGT